MPVGPPDPNAVQTVLVHEAESEEAVTPSVENFRALVHLTDIATWRESPSGQRVQSRRAGATPPRAPQFEEEEEGAGDK